MDVTVNQDFIEIVNEEGAASFINLTQVRSVDEVSDTHCRLWFAADHSSEINGNAARLVVRAIRNRSSRLTRKIVPGFGRS
jgi:hypothetical protein